MQTRPIGHRSDSQREVASSVTGHMPIAIAK